MSLNFPPLLLLPFLIPAMAATPAPSNLPQVDFSRMGTVGLGGSFSGLDWWSDSSAFSSTSNSSSAFSTTGDTVFVRMENGTYQPIGSTNAGGRISALCYSNSSDGTLYIGGDFDSISGNSFANLASYSTGSQAFSAVGSGTSGPVETLFCDDQAGEVWVGGLFDATEGSGGNVARWSTSSSSWSSIPFGGLNGRVDTIKASTDGSSVYFGGHFTTTFASNSSLANRNSTTSGNITSVPSAPDGTATTGNSGYLTPVLIPYSANQDPTVQIEIDASPSSSQRNFADPHVLVCPGEAMWLAQDNSPATVDIVGVNWMRASGIRVTNALVQGRGTKTFSFTSTPDNALVSLTYTDPATGQNQTCTDSCPLSTDSSLSVQDYIFTDGPKDLTGLRMDLKEWIGDGAGLSSVQLLSDGAFGSAIPNTNKPLCPGNLPSSSASTSGDWSVQQHTTSDPHINSYYLTANVDVGSNDHPSVNFYPYVSASAIYNIYISIPGCSVLGDCNGRTDIDIEVNPVTGGLGFTSTISEQVQEDTRTLVYSGPVDASSSNFTPTVVLSLSKNATAPASGNTYTVVADSVIMYLTEISDGSTNTSRSSGTSVNGTSTSNMTLGDASVAFGLFEYVKDSNNTVDAATSTMSNTSETAFSALGMALDAAYNSSNQPARWTVNAIATANNTVYLAGDFAVSGNYSNVVQLDVSTRQSRSLAMMGLNGVVHAALVVGESVYFGGEFTSTASSGGQQLNRLARWDTAASTWSAVAGGVNGPVTDLMASPTTDGQIIVIGNFSGTAGADGSSNSSGGYAVYDPATSGWVSSGLLYGNLTAAATGSGVQNTYLAGRVIGSSANPVNGLAMLSTGDNNVPSISSWPDVNFGSAGSAPASSSSPARREVKGFLSTRGLFARLTDSLSPRSHLHTRADPPTISPASAPAPAVLAGAFWTNASASGSPTVTIIGGNFTSVNGSTEIEGVGFYTEGQGLTGPSPPVSGLVRALNVVGNNVYIGGQGVNASGVGAGLLVYNLQSRSWVTGGMSSLAAASGNDLVVNGIHTRGDTNTVVVTGNFVTAGSLSCAAVCLWDAENAQWHTPGQGLQSGEVRAIDFAGDSADTLVAAGSFELNNGDVAYVATYDFGNATWTNLGSLPGPALAVAVDNKNASSVYAAGYSTNGAEPYLQRWDGQTWSEQNSTLLPGSVVSQLAFVPLSSAHKANGPIENDRMLMVSGSLYLEDVGNATSALYDGAAMHPFLVGTTSAGSLGSASSLFWSNDSFSFNIRHYLARGLVVLVAIAIATGLILLLVLIFLLIACIAKRRDNSRAPKQEMYEREGSDISSTHQNVFNNVQAALEQSLLGGGLAAGSGAAAAAASKNRRSDPSDYGAAGAYDDHEEDGDDEGRETTMRYDFDGPELQPGEMSMKAGQRVIVLDDVQSDEWWYARDPATGREGVVPATYVW